MTSIRSRHTKTERAPDVRPNEREATGAGRQETLEQSVLRSLDRYFSDLNGARPHALHELVMQAVNWPTHRPKAKVQRPKSKCPRLLALDFGLKTLDFLLPAAARNFPVRNKQRILPSPS